MDLHLDCECDTVHEGNVLHETYAHITNVALEDIMMSTFLQPSDVILAKIIFVGNSTTHLLQYLKMYFYWDLYLSKISFCPLHFDFTVYILINKSDKHSTEHFTHFACFT